ncbi:hypothetical protein [Pedobacter sp. Leaf41]|uniref:hypothetical protein n=1 Tax=Pedobacter sp. Leaf41 TaxID=1736218 RepID=UPI0012FBA254|nr:hypothetical protein [Pedobacter sp. Leaf41]
MKNRANKINALPHTHPFLYFLLPATYRNGDITKPEVRKTRSFYKDNTSNPISYYSDHFKLQSSYRQDLSHPAIRHSKL